jgi:predicted nucleotide-binding protein (sugar kinase/HSP70/actin superfamily)
MIEKEKRIVGIPEFSLYAKHFLRLFHDLGLKTLDVIPITEETTKLGVKYAPEMMCFPYKVVLGNFLQLLEQGANTLIMFSSCGKCKLRHYYKLVEQKLQREGYEFEMIKITPRDLLPIPLPGFLDSLVMVSGLPRYAVAKIAYQSWKNVIAIEKSQYERPWGAINIGLTGEIYSVLEPSINHSIKEQIEAMGGTVHITLSLRELIQELVTNSLWRSKERKALRERCWEYLDRGGDPGGHGLHSVEDVFLWAEKNIDGIIHVTPLSCHPEILVEDAIDHICADKNIPLLRIKIDETISPLNITTRVETFFELIKRKKQALRLSAVDVGRQPEILAQQTPILSS